MGLDVSHGDFHMSYSGFNELRQRISKSLGFNLSNFQGFGGNKRWYECKSPIKALLNHSDCDGDLTVPEMINMLPELKRVCKSWEESIYKNSFEELIESIEIAIQHKQPLIFC
jgi:hypothetical protein